MFKTSHRGSRDRNDDFVDEQRFYLNHRLIYVLVACDGVGGQPAGDQCAQAVGRKVLELTKEYLGHRSTQGVLNETDARSIVNQLKTIDINGVPQESATTLALAIFDPKGGMIAIWAGDSRVYLLDASGELQQMTEDHHNKAGHLTSCIAGGGQVRGEIAYRFVPFSKRPCAIAVTTDGVHGSCQPDEPRQYALRQYALRHYLFYCISQKLPHEEFLKETLPVFLRDDDSDNFSMVIYYYRLSNRRIRLIAPDLIEEK